MNLDEAMALSPPGKQALMKHLYLTALRTGRKVVNVSVGEYTCEEGFCMFTSNEGFEGQPVCFNHYLRLTRALG